MGRRDATFRRLCEAEGTTRADPLPWTWHALAHPWRYDRGPDGRRGGVVAGVALPGAHHQQPEAAPTDGPGRRWNSTPGGVQFPMLNADNLLAQFQSILPQARPTTTNHPHKNLTSMKLSISTTAACPAPTPSRPRVLGRRAERPRHASPPPKSATNSVNRLVTLLPLASRFPFSRLCDGTVRCRRAGRFRWVARIDNRTLTRIHRSPRWFSWRRSANAARSLS